MNRGLLLYLSAAMPEREEHAAAAEEAILSLSRALYAEGGRLLVNPENDIVTLVALVAAEYVAIEPKEEGEPREQETRHPEVPVIVLARPWEGGPAGEEHLAPARFGYIWLSRPEERHEWMARAGAMISIGRQDRRDWEDFQRSANRRRPIAVFPSTGAEGPEGADRGWEGRLEEVDARFHRWMAERREAEREWEEFGEPFLAETRWLLLMQWMLRQLGEG
jgi:hypothetical protein